MSSIFFGKFSGTGDTEASGSGEIFGFFRCGCVGGGQ